MTVKELLKILQDCNENDVVVLSRDAEGNGFRPLDDVQTDSLYEDGEVYLKELTEEDKKEGYGEEDVGSEDSIPAVILWPTHRR